MKPICSSGRDEFCLSSLGLGIVAFVVMGVGCVDLTNPLGRVKVGDAGGDAAGGIGGQTAPVDGNGGSGGTGGDLGSIEAGPAIPDAPASGGSSAAGVVDGGIGSGGVGGTVDANLGILDASGPDAPGGTGGSIDVRLAETGSVAADAAPDAPSGGADGAGKDAPGDTAAGSGGSGGTISGGAGGSSVALGGSGGSAAGTGGGGTGGSGTGGSGTGGSATGTGGGGTGGSGTGGSGTGGAGTGGSGTGGVGTGGTTSGDAGVCSGYVGSGAGGLTQGLVAYYPCDSASGTSLPDQSGNNHAGTLVTGSGGAIGYSFGPGKVNNALILNQASHGYVTLPPGILAGACEATVASWVYLNTNNTTTSQWQRIWDFGTSSTSGYMFLAASTNLAASSNAVRFAISRSDNASGAEQFVDGAQPLPTKAWHHVALVLGSAGAVLYVDGAQVGAKSTVTLRPADLGNTPNNYIGRSEFPDPYLDGNIDEFRIYNRALSPAEILALASGS